MQLLAGQEATTSRSSRRSRQVNECQKRVLVDEDARRTSASLKGKTIAVWGLAFKPKTDDMREAPAIPLIEALLGQGRQGAGLRSRGDEGGQGHLRQHDHAMPTKNYDALKGADALAIVTEWHEFREPDFARMQKLMQRR